MTALPCLARRALAALLLAAGSAAAAPPEPGDFDYYVLALSWSPSWCATEGDAGAEQCAPGRRADFLVHGLWPQHERGGWPQDCAGRAADPTRRETAAMADVMGSGGLAWYQWQKHGRCTGLDARAYFATLRRAAAAVTVPPLFDGLFRDLRLPAATVEDAFLAVNPRLTRDGITVRCGDGLLREVRICLTRDLEPRACAPDIRADCRAVMLMPAVR